MKQRSQRLFCCAWSSSSLQHKQFMTGSSSGESVGTLGLVVAVFPTDSVLTQGVLHRTF